MSGQKQADEDGNFRRQVSSFRDTISPDGPFPPEKDRYILYVALVCPWATRALFVLSLKGLEEFIDVSILDYELTAKGWTFDRRTKEATGDPVYGKEYLREIYHKHDPDYSQRFTVPVLFDKKQGKVVNNESSEIIRILNTSFDDLLPQQDPHRGLTFYPAEHVQEIDQINEWVYDKINNGVYKTGFASTQEVYDSNVLNVFDGLDKLEALLSDGRKYLIASADRLTEADIRLLPTLIRFDSAYVTLFKCNIRTIRDGYPHINRYLQDLYWNTPAFQKWTNFDHIKKGYSVLGNGITPAGPIPSIMPL